MITKFKNFIKSILRQLKNKVNIIIFVIVLIITYSPVWLVGGLGFIFQNKAMLAIATAYALFWAGPFTPYFPLCIGLTFIIRKIYDKIKRHNWRRWLQIEIVKENPSRDARVDLLYKSFHFNSILFSSPYIPVIIYIYKISFISHCVIV